jgi:hypothetical protein
MLTFLTIKLWLISINENIIMKKMYSEKRENITKCHRNFDFKERCGIIF